jgi:diacylglycerol kinase (ATP)
MSLTKTALIVNTKARTGEVALAQAEQRLKEHGVALQSVHSVKKGSHLSEAIQQSLREGAEIVVIGGGDGSLRTAAGFLVHTEVALGVIPLGTVNDFARNLGIEATIESACRVIAEGHTALVDVGQANEDIFLITASLGFSAEAQHALSPGLKRVLGPFGYVAASLLVLNRLRGMHITIQSEQGEEKLKVMQAGVINGHYWIGGAFQIPGVDLTEDYLAFYALPPQSVTAFLQVVRNLRSGNFFITPGLRAFTTREIVINTPRPKRLVLDGDLCGKTPVRFLLLPNALRVCVPETFRQAQISTSLLSTSNQGET